jgi:hypothetical protein
MRFMSAEGAHAQQRFPSIGVMALNAPLRQFFRGQSTAKKSEAKRSRRLPERFRGIQRDLSGMLAEARFALEETCFAELGAMSPSMESE